MTDLLDRQVTAATAEPTAAAKTSAWELSMPLRVLLGCLSASAAVIHLAMVPAHAGESIVEGVGFAVSGWVQVLLAVVLVARPSRRWLALAIVANVAFVATWAISRTVGLPVGAGGVETANVVDLTCVAAEVALVLVAAVAWFRPGLGRGWDSGALVMASAIPVAILIGTTAVVVSPSATAHNHGTEAAAGHTHGAPVGDDKGLSTLTNGHVHAHAADVALDRTTQAQLNAQLARTAGLVVRYPTVAAAEAAGYHRAGPFTPGLGAHYMPPKPVFNPEGVMDDASLDAPMLIFDGMTPDAPLAGFMYLAYRTTEPAGFVGPNDHWHYHTNVCITMTNGVLDTPLGADAENIDPALCAQYGGSIIDNTGYMLHVWTVPGYESSNGIFSDVNPAITCPDGTYHHIELTELGNRTTTCLA